MNKKSILFLTTTAALALCWRVSAFNPQPDPPAFAMIGVNPGETIRVTAKCVAERIADVNPGPCVVAFVFSDINGRVLKTSTRTLQPGTGAFEDLAGVQIPSSELPGRVELLPSVHSVNQILASVETFDTLTGKTSIYSNAAVPKTSFLIGLLR